GTLNNGVVNFNVIYNTPGPLPADNKNASPNIFANPYASAISADDFITANAMVDEVYFWEHLTPPSSTLPGAGAMNFHMQDISMYNLMGGTQAANDLIGTTTPNGVISTGQGFGIKANAAGTAVFNNSMRLTSGNTTLRGPDVNRERIWLKISNTAFDMQNTTLIGFSDNATAGLDSGYDSRRLATVLSLYSHLEDGTQQLGIQSREAFESGIKVPLGFSSQLEGEWEYSLSIADLEGANLSEATVYLMDNLLGTVVNLSEAPYVFRSIEGTFHGRFTVMFEYEPTLGIGGDVLQQINMFPNPTEHVVNIVSPKAIIQSIAVYDLQGRKILMEQHQSNNVQIDFSDLQSSVYFVEIRTESGTVSKRVVRK
ncbi:MAG TPA: T9SS type A sorting domain-containing protein, partial [Flavobacteriaceae bacterium]|nr:T9SS type A sorting domain-containing protein [Flavobacteriaceae bacterium]HQU21513.1 T9SS type A sorting domain-containing protein [Flavobacteriaceae bacterium]HQU65663.1 T9SS type A sorting domain-containing protein [Flavobacteriaceae bacterium]HRW44832.1 T9SS type A sorting domain-containing protein [Flavobacteriaceae bacterium]